jgi:hypothetical protein
MKKYAILALAALMVVAFALPASALENEFGGFWDTRFQTKGYFDGQQNEDGEQNVETRTRLYYTAKINDNLKLVNKFEMDATWGGPGTYGRIGADTISIEVKNTYADFNVGPVNFTVGAQPYVLFNSYFIDTDASGVIARWKVLDNFVLAASWLKALELPGVAGDGVDSNENGDTDSYTLSAAFWFSENISIKPSINWTYANDAVAIGIGEEIINPGDAAGELNRYTYGLDFEMAYDSWGLWATAVGQAGQVEDVTSAALGLVDDDIDFKGYLLAVGGNVMLGPVDIYGEAAYASGSDDPDELGFSNSSGSHSWSELLADGTLWGGTPAGGGGTYDVVTNLFYAGGGVKFSPMEKLTINPSVWYAKLDEDNQTGEDELGTEVDLVVKYQLVEGMNLELIGAYLFAGDAFSNIAAENDEDAYEYGMRLSLSF